MCYNYILKGTYAEHNFAFTLWALPAGSDSKEQWDEAKDCCTLICKKLGGVYSSGKKTAKVPCPGWRKIIHLIWEEYEGTV